MKKLFAAFLFILVLAGCAGGLSSLAYENQTNINRLTAGMTKAAVMEVMGTKTAKTRDGIVANPFRSEIFQDKSGTQYEVLYYVTEKNRAYQPLKVGQTTPLVFKNGVLVGWGNESLRRAKELSAREININIER